jgi:cellulose synthase/poly-beta-1,6-N-acetylglucosamine synthase-like glycosyltransferase
LPLTFAEAFWWLGVAWLIYVYAGYPLLLGLIGLVARVRTRAREGRWPSVSVLIAARNEEKDIGWKIRETLAWEYPADRLEVLVASDASDDRTDEIVRGFQDPRVHLVRMEKRGGKVRALNRLAELARGEILFFTDANASIPAGCLRLMVRHFADPRVGCVTGITRGWDPKSAGAVSQGAGLYFRYESLIASLESRLGSVLACDGAVHCLRRELFAPLQPELANDLEAPLRVARSGRLTLFEPGAYALEKETEAPAEEFARRRRIAAQGALAMWRFRGALAGLRGWQFVSHKFLRWLTPLPLAAVLAGSAALAHRPFYALALAAQGIFYAAALAALLQARQGKHVSRALAVPFYVLLGATATLVGVVEAALGRSFDVWEVATLSRGAQNAGS